MRAHRGCVLAPVLPASGVTAGAGFPLGRESFRSVMSPPRSRRLALEPVVGTFTPAVAAGDGSLDLPTGNQPDAPGREESPPCCAVGTARAAREAAAGISYLQETTLQPVARLRPKDTFVRLFLRE